MPKEQLFMVILLSSLGGAFFGVIIPSLSFLFFLGIVWGILLYLFTKEKIVWIGILFVWLCGFNSYLKLVQLQTSPLLKFNDTNISVVLEGTVTQEPQSSFKFQKLIIKTKKLNNQKAWGNILVYLSDQKEYFRGDQVAIKGRLLTPKNFGEFDYKKYLWRNGILSVMYNPEIQLTKKTSLFWENIFKLKQKAREIIDKSLPYPENILLRSILLGDKKDLPKELKEIFNNSGLRHITAISGMHITILMTILLFVLINIGLKRQLAGLIVIGVILIYLLFVGFQPSALRASIMGAGLILAQIIGRLPDAIRFLMFAGVLMLLFNPLLVYNIGFQLSFLAATGINYLGSFFNNLLQSKVSNQLIRNTLAMTFSAQIFTFPLLLFHFGKFPLIAPITNLLVVPLIPFVIGLGLFALVINIFSKVFVFLFIPLFYLLNYIIKIAQVGSHFSFLLVQFKIPIFFVIISYLFLAYFTYKITQRQKYWFLNL